MGIQHIHPQRELILSNQERRGDRARRGDKGGKYSLHPLPPVSMFSKFRYISITRDSSIGRPHCGRIIWASFFSISSSTPSVLSRTKYDCDLEGRLSTCVRRVDLYSTWLACGRICWWQSRALSNKAIHHPSNKNQEEQEQHLTPFLHHFSFFFDWETYQQEILNMQKN